MKDAKSYRVSPNITSGLSLSKPGFFLHTFPINNVVYIIFWPWRPVDILWPLFDKGCSTRKLIFPWFSSYFQSMSASESAKQSYILTEQRCSELQQRKNQLAQRSNVGNSKAAAAAAKSLQSCPTLCDPIDGSPPGPAIPRILQARTLEWVAISSSNAWKWSRSIVSDS